MAAYDAEPFAKVDLYYPETVTGPVKHIIESRPALQEFASSVLYKTDPGTGRSVPTYTNFNMVLPWSDGYELTVSYNLYDAEVHTDASFKAGVSAFAKCVYKQATCEYNLKTLNLFFNAEEDAEELPSAPEIAVQLEHVLAQFRLIREITPGFVKDAYAVKPTYKIVGAPPDSDTGAGKKRFAAYKAAAKAQIVAFNMLAKL